MSISGLSESIYGNSYSWGNDELANLLIEYGNNPEKYPAIAWATKLGHTDVVRKLISFGVDYKDAYAGGSNLLEIAIKQHHLDLAAFFIQSDLKQFNIFYMIDALQDNDVLQFLELHSLLDKYKTVEMLAQLIDKKAPFSVIRFLINHGADCVSIIHGAPDIYEKWFKPPYDKNFKEKDRIGLLTLLNEYCCSYTNPADIRFLIDHGTPFNTNMDYQSGWNPFLSVVRKASQTKNPQEIKQWNSLVTYMIEKGAKWPSDGAHFSNTITCCISALNNHNFDLIVLMSKVCDCLELSCIRLSNPEYPDKTPRCYLYTPLQYAVLMNMEEVVAQLLKNGANPNGIGKDNFLIANEAQTCKKTPLDLAIQNKNAQIAKLLLSFGSVPR